MYVIVQTKSFVVTKAGELSTLVVTNLPKYVIINKGKQDMLSKHLKTTKTNSNVLNFHWSFFPSK